MAVCHTFWAFAILKMDKTFVVGHIEKTVDFTIFDTKWIPGTAKVVALGNKPNGHGILQIFQMNSGKLDVVDEFTLKSRLKCASFGASPLRKTHVAIATFDGRFQMLDLERMTTVHDAEAHKGIVNCLDAIGGGLMLNCGAPEIATGGADGTVKIWDIRQKCGPVACIEPTKEPNSTIRECWTVAFGDSFNNQQRAVCAGYDNGDVKLFDLRNMRVQWEEHVKNGVCHIEFDRRDIPMNKMAVATLEGGLLVYDLRTQHATKGFACVREKDAGRSLGSNGVVHGAKATVWCARHLPQNREIFASCGGTGSIRLWLYQYPEKRARDTAGEVVGVAGSLKMLHATTVSSQPINCFDWCPDRIGLAVCGSFDQTVRILIATNLHLY